MEILVTNNPLVRAKYQSGYKVEFLDADLLGVLTFVRDCVHRGSTLLTHPLSGSVKPNESPYKSILISSASGSTDTQSVMIIEECILTEKKFPAKSIPDKYLQDMQLVDLTLISTALENKN